MVFISLKVNESKGFLLIYNSGITKSNERAINCRKANKIDASLAIYALQAIPVLGLLNATTVWGEILDDILSQYEK